MNKKLLIVPLKSKIS